MQDELSYYIENTFKTLFAFGRRWEFFKQYFPSEKKWKTSKISFSQFLHDYECSLISREAAFELTGGNLPEEAYEEYCRNLSGIGNK